MSDEDGIWFDQSVDTDAETSWAEAVSIMSVDWMLMQVCERSTEVSNKKGVFETWPGNHAPVFFFFHLSRMMKDGNIWYLVKWRDLPYDQSTWEMEDHGLILELAKAVDDYYAIRYTHLGDEAVKKPKKPRGRKKAKRSKKRRSKKVDEMEDDEDDDDDDEEEKEERGEEWKERVRQKMPPDEPCIDVSVGRAVQMSSQGSE